MSVWLDLFHPGPCFRWALSSVLWRLPDCAAFSVVRWWPKPHLTMENATFAGNRLPTWGGKLGSGIAFGDGNRHRIGQPPPNVGSGPRPVRRLAPKTAT